VAQEEVPPAAPEAVADQVLLAALAAKAAVGYMEVV
jgi:hypothetical protein